MAREESERLHNTFMSMTQQLLTSELEVSLYEDQVRGKGRQDMHACGWGI